MHWQEVFFRLHHSVDVLEAITRARKPRIVLKRMTKFSFCPLCELAALLCKRAASPIAGAVRVLLTLRSASAVTVSRSFVSFSLFFRMSDTRVGGREDVQRPPDVGCCFDCGCASDACTCLCIDWTDLDALGPVLEAQPQAVASRTGGEVDVLVLFPPLSPPRGCAPLPPPLPSHPPAPPPLSPTTPGAAVASGAATTSGAALSAQQLTFSPGTTPARPRSVVRALAKQRRLAEQAAASLRPPVQLSLQREQILSQVNAVAALAPKAARASAALWLEARTRMSSCRARVCRRFSHTLPTPPAAVRRLDRSAGGAARERGARGGRDGPPAAQPGFRY